MGIYDKRKSVSRIELRKTLRTSRRISRTGGKRYTAKEVEAMHKEVFSPKYGSNISRQDYRRAISGLKRSQKIDYLKDLGGRNV